MKIEEIIELIEQDLSECTDSSMSCCAECKDKKIKIIAALEKMRPTTITDNPATWPPVGTPVLLRAYYYHETGKSVDPEIVVFDEDMDNNVSSENIRDLIGGKWQYLPEWEG